jgi:orotate phosphoribosyltransferase
MALYRVDQSYMLTRINGEELIAGALRTYARNPVIEDGVAANVFFFEPFENVFQHAFVKTSDDDLAIMAMRVTDWMFTDANEIKPQSRSLLSKLAPWQREFTEHIQSPFMEIVVCDCGRGITDSIIESLDKPDHDPFVSLDGKLIPTQQIKDDPWTAIKYAFEPHTTRKKEPLPGRRGLAWLKEKMSFANGAIQVQSNGATYVLADIGGGLTEYPQSVAQLKKIVFNKQVIGYGYRLQGTFVHMMFPLRRVPPKRALARNPRWRKLVEAPPLFGSPKSELVAFQVLTELTTNPSSADWDSYLSKIENDLSPSSLAVLDFRQQRVTRVALEHFFDHFSQHAKLHGRIIAINCDRHLVSRLDTVDAIDRLKASDLIFPLFEPTLRMHWVGVSTDVESTLLKSFFFGPTESLRELVDLTSQNAGYFLHSADRAIDFSFSLEMIEELARSLLGDQMLDSLSSRKAINTGRFILPNKRVVATYVEPHQIFTDPNIGNLLCNHLATLLRFRYSRVSVSKPADVRVLTATRIGRDIAMRMPAGFPQKFFVYYDYHLVRPDKPRLGKYLAGRSVVIVVDIISTGSQVNELIRICEDAGAFVIGVVSFIDFAVEATGHLFKSRGQNVEHKTFKKLPQTFSDPRPGDIPVDKYTLSISPLPDMEQEEVRDGSAIMSLNRSLKMLEDCQVLQYGN